MVVLDTDLLSLIERDGPAGQRLRARLRELDHNEVVTTIVNYEEQMRGWLTVVARARTVAKQIEAYARLRRFVESYRGRPLLDFDEAAAVTFQRLRKAYLRLGANDLKIAAITIANDAKLLSRNLSHFGQIPDLDAEDWTA